MKKKYIMPEIEEAKRRALEVIKEYEELKARKQKGQIRMTKTLRNEPLSVIETEDLKDLVFLAIVKRLVQEGTCREEYGFTEDSPYHDWIITFQNTHFTKGGFMRREKKNNKRRSTGTAL